MEKLNLTAVAVGSFDAPSLKLFPVKAMGLGLYATSSTSLNVKSFVVRVSLGRGNSLQLVQVSERYSTVT